MARRRVKKSKGEITFIHYRVKNFMTFCHIKDKEGNVIETKEIRFENGILNTDDPDIIQTLEEHQDYGIHLLSASAFEQSEYHKTRQGIVDVIGEPDETLDEFLNEDAENEFLNEDVETSAGG